MWFVVIISEVVCSDCLFVSAFREGRKDSQGEGAGDLQREEGNRFQPEERGGLKRFTWTLLVGDAKSTETIRQKQTETQLVQRVRGPEPDLLSAPSTPQTLSLTGQQVTLCMSSSDHLCKRHTHYVVYATEGSLKKDYRCE